MPPPISDTGTAQRWKNLLPSSGTREIGLPLLPGTLKFPCISSRLDFPKVSLNFYDMLTRESCCRVP